MPYYDRTAERRAVAAEEAVGEKETASHHDNICCVSIVFRPQRLSS